MADYLHKELTFAVIGAAMEVHRILGGGFLEAVYQKALAHELILRHTSFQQQVRLPVLYKDVLMGEYVADFVIERKIVVEIKSVSKLNSGHLAQAVHYLAATGLRLALLVNFGSDSLEQRRVIK